MRGRRILGRLLTRPHEEMNAQRSRREGHGEKGGRGGDGGVGQGAWQLECADAFACQEGSCGMEDSCAIASVLEAIVVLYVRDRLRPAYNDQCSHVLPPSACARCGVRSSLSDASQGRYNMSRAVFYPKRMEATHTYFPGAGLLLGSPVRSCM